MTPGTLGDFLRLLSSMGVGANDRTKVAARILVGAFGESYISKDTVLRMVSDTATPSLDPMRTREAHLLGRRYLALTGYHDLSRSEAKLYLLLLETAMVARTTKVDMTQRRAMEKVGLDPKTYRKAREGLASMGLVKVETGQGDVYRFQSEGWASAFLPAAPVDGVWDFCPSAFDRCGISVLVPETQSPSGFLALTVPVRTGAKDKNPTYMSLKTEGRLSCGIFVLAGKKATPKDLVLHGAVQAMKLDGRVLALAYLYGPDPLPRDDVAERYRMSPRNATRALSALRGAGLLEGSNGGFVPAYPLEALSEALDALSVDSGWQEVAAARTETVKAEREDWKGKRAKVQAQRRHKEAVAKAQTKKPVARELPTLDSMDLLM